jgi:transcriptional regulator with XRE-family HTH domain
MSTKIVGLDKKGLCSENRTMSLFPTQCRAARGWLGWTQDDLAKRAKVGLSTVRDFEAGRRTPIPNNLDALRRAIEEAGIRLLYTDDGKALGVAGEDDAQVLRVTSIPASGPGKRRGSGARESHATPSQRSRGQ